MYFYTATINSWKHLLLNDELKNVILDSLKWFDNNKRAAISSFVIMPNHIHLVWAPLQKYSEEENETALLSFSAHKFKKYLAKNEKEKLGQFSSTQSDREYHFWERRSRTIEIMSRRIAEQKITYIHNNPCQPHWKLVANPIDYFYSSAKFYETDIKTFDFITHYSELI